jgi:pimeloyl-ACP methyl ester carboxylesterase
VLQGLDAVRDYPEIKVPVYFVHGRHDRQVSANQAKDYFEKVVAPAKEMIWFEESAHSPPFEEPEKFKAEIRRIANLVAAR